MHCFSPFCVIPAAFPISPRQGPPGPEAAMTRRGLRPWDPKTPAQMTLLLPPNTKHSVFPLGYHMK